MSRVWAVGAGMDSMAMGWHSCNGTDRVKP